LTRLRKGDESRVDLKLDEREIEFFGSAVGLAD
jgi:hypothetical protein